jgi:hypothetical protein
MTREGTQWDLGQNAHSNMRSVIWINRLSRQPVMISTPTGRQPVMESFERVLDKFNWLKLMSSGWNANDVSPT